jgi:hypothetical protein
VGRDPANGPTELLVRPRRDELDLAVRSLAPHRPTSLLFGTDVRDPVSSITFVRAYRRASTSRLLLGLDLDRREQSLQSRTN